MPDKHQTGWIFLKALISRPRTESEGKTRSYVCFSILAFSHCFDFMSIASNGKVEACPNRVWFLRFWWMLHIWVYWHGHAMMQMPCWDVATWTNRLQGGCDGWHCKIKMEVTCDFRLKGFAREEAQTLHICHWSWNGASGTPKGTNEILVFLHYIISF